MFARETCGHRLAGNRSPSPSKQSSSTCCDGVSRPRHKVDRRSQKMERYRIVEGVGVYFVTFSIVEWLPVFIDEPPCKIVADSLNFCIEQKDLRVNAYVIMLNHLHAIVFDHDFNSERLKHTLDDFRKFTGRQLADYCGQHMPPYYTETFRRHAGEDRQRRFWQPTQHPEGIVTDRF